MNAMWIPVGSAVAIILLSLGVLEAEGPALSYRWPGDPRDDARRRWGRSLSF